MTRLFPLWARALELDAELVGRDLPLDAPRDSYRAAVEHIRADERTRGALVTTHKLAVLASARDLFDELDADAERLGEVSCIAKRGGRLLGRATDPATAGGALDALGPPPGHVLCLGAGGAGAAIVLHLLGRADRPEWVVVTDTRPARLAEVARLGDVETAPAEAAREQLEALPPGSLVINATGLGKDRPGSPLPDGARFPDGGVAWDLNYRGDLRFLAQARAQGGLRVEDGWLYFLLGWSAIVGEVFALDVTPERFGRLRAIADAHR